MDNNPLVSVIMPVYNGEQYITAAIESILNQTYKNYELIVVNDGSTDGTEKILRTYYGRIKIIDQQNSGLVNALNAGINIAQGKYIARLDSDDLAENDRLEIQMDFLEQHPDIGILGSTSRLINEDGKNWGIQKVPITDESIRWVSLFKCPFIHSSVMFRKEMLDQNNLSYREEFLYAEDYDLWIQLLKYSKGANLSTPLIYYRGHKSSITSTKHKSTLHLSKSISNEAIKVFLPSAYSFFRMNEIGEIRELLYANTKHYKELQSTRSQTVNNYLRLWELFVKERSLCKKDKKHIQKQVVIRACQMALFPPYANNWQNVTSELWRLDRLWWLTFLASLPSGISSFIRERYFWKFN